MEPSQGHTEYLKLAREIEASAGGVAHRLAVLSSFTADFLKPYVLVESERLGCLLQPWFGPFGQFEPLVLDAASPLWAEAPELIWVALRLEDLDRHLADEVPGLRPEDVAARLAAVRERLVALVAAARERFQGPILVSNLTLLDQDRADVFDASNPDGVVHLLAEQNRLLAGGLASLSDVHVFDYADCVATLGRSTWRDLRLWYLARAPLAREALLLLARRLARAAAATLRPSAKVIVVDLDNTLWGGVLGDDGPASLQLGDDHPGSAYKDLQAALLGYRRRGFLLAVSSKNDESLVRETLETHPEMLLRVEHFAAIEANWEPKPANLVRIAETLNVGLDSLLFVDDNPVERAQVQAELPMVRVVELPQDPTGFLAALREVAELDRPRLVAEDRTRAEMYQQEAARQSLQQGEFRLEDFLVRLEMTAEVGRLDDHTQERIHQLIQKTNQFNLTTRRHNLGEVRRMAAAPGSEVCWLRLRDRFGELGLVCVGILLRLDEKLWEIDTLLMSCRVMGRNVEDAFLSYLAELARARGAERLRGVFARTRKNAPVARFYQEHGFEEMDRPEEDLWIHEAKLDADRFAWPSHIQRVDASEEPECRTS